MRSSHCELKIRLPQLQQKLVPAPVARPQTPQQASAQAGDGRPGWRCCSSCRRGCCRAWYCSGCCCCGFCWQRLRGGCCRCCRCCSCRLAAAAAAAVSGAPLAVETSRRSVPQARVPASCDECKQVWRPSPKWSGCGNAQCMGSGSGCPCLCCIGRRRCCRNGCGKFCGCGGCICCSPSPGCLSAHFEPGACRRH